MRARAVAAILVTLLMLIAASLWVPVQPAGRGPAPPEFPRGLYYCPIWRVGQELYRFDITRPPGPVFVLRAPAHIRWPVLIGEYVLIAAIGGLATFLLSGGDPRT